MWVDVDHFKSHYNKIKTSSLKGESTVLIFVTCELDSLCAAKILTSLLKSDFITYQLEPISNYDDLVVAAEKYASKKIKTIILLNAGGNIAISELFEQPGKGELFPDAMFYILDSHRPFNLTNVFSDRVWIFDDGESQGKIPRESDLFSSDEEEDYENTHEVDAAARKRRKRQDAAEREERRQNRHQVLEDYYMSTYYALPISLILWKLAIDTGKKNNSLLWLAAIGLTDSFIHERLTLEKYGECLQEVRSDVLNLNDEESEGNESSHEFKIVCKDDYRFMLLRHWNLFDAMFHSRFVASRLEVWRTSGLAKFKNLLAKMGVSLEQSKRHYTSMDVKVRDRLDAMLERHCAEFGLNGFSFPSFACIAQYGSPISASDFVYSITALLEQPDKEWKTSFFEALDALNTSTPAPLLRGIALAKSMEPIMMRQVGTLLDEVNGIKKTKNYRYVIIKDHPDQNHFIHPISLHRLGLFLLEIFQYSRAGRKKALPLLIAALDHKTENFVVFGSWPPSGEGELKNPIGTYFRNTAAEKEFRVKMTHFDSAVMEIKKDDMNNFVACLNQLLQSEL